MSERKKEKEGKRARKRDVINNINFGKKILCLWIKKGNGVGKLCFTQTENCAVFPWEL